MKQILVTGGFGFIGLHLVKHLLEKGNQVIVIDNLPALQYDDEIKNLIEQYTVELQVQPYDLTTLENWPEVDEVYHLASGLPASRIQADSYELIYRSLAILENMLYSYNVSEKRTKILYVSALAAVGNVTEEYPVKETTAIGWKDPFNPRSTYGFSKFIGEQILTQFARNTLFRYNIARLSAVYGERMQRNYIVKDLITRNLKAEAPLRLMSAFDTDTLLYVQDAVEGLVAVMESDFEKQTFNLSTAEETTTLELAIKIGNLFGSEEKNIQVVLDDDDESRERRIADVTKTKALLNWEAQVSLATGLERTVQYYKDRFFLKPVTN